MESDRPVQGKRSSRRVHNSHGPDDDTLGRMFKSGQPQALREAFTRWSAIVCGLVTYSGTGHMADDVTAKVFINAWQHRDVFDPDADSLPSWLISITRSLLKAPRPTEINVIDLTDSSHGQPVMQPTADLGARLLVQDELSRLPTQQRKVARLAIADHVPDEQIADQMNISVPLVQRDLSDSLRRLRSRVEAGHVSL